MFVSWDNCSNPPDNHLWRLLNHWYTLREKESTATSLNPKRCREAIFHLIRTVRPENVNPGLGMNDFTRLTGKRNMYRNLQHRGDYMTNALLLGKSLDLFLEGVIDDLTKKFHVSSDVDTKTLIRKAFRRMRSWMAYRFLGALRVIFLQKRLNAEKTRVATLQEEVSDGLFFLESFFQGFNKLPPKDHSWIYTKGQAICSKSINISDHSHVLACYMHHNKRSQPPSGPIMKLLEEWFSTPVNLNNSKTHSRDFHKVLLLCYNSFARLDIL